MNDVFVAAGATTYPLIRPQRSTTIGVICLPHFGLREGQDQMLFLHKSYTRKALCFPTASFMESDQKENARWPPAFVKQRPQEQ